MAKKRFGGGRPGPGVSQARRPTKAERKDEARRERDEIRRRMARQRRNRQIAIAGLAVVVAVVVVFAVTRPKSSSKAASSTGTLPGVLTGAPPWPANAADLSARLEKMDLPAPGGAMHIHAHLDVFVDGNPVEVPGDIGLGPGVESSIHTHSTDGVIHMEAASAATFTLGEFFDVWGVRFTPTCIGGSCASGDQKLELFVDGKPYTGDPAGLALGDHQEVVVAFGTEAQLPSPIPSTFDWASASL